MYSGFMTTWTNGVVWSRLLIWIIVLYMTLHLFTFLSDTKRQDEIDTFYETCQRQRDYYRGYPKAYHPLTFFIESTYRWQCPPEMTTTYLSFPNYHVKYKQPLVLPNTIGRTSGIPDLPDRTLAGRYNKAACKAFDR